MHPEINKRVSKTLAFSAAWSKIGRESSTREKFIMYTLLISDDHLALAFVSHLCLDLLRYFTLSESHPPPAMNLKISYFDETMQP